MRFSRVVRALGFSLLAFLRLLSPQTAPAQTGPAQTLTLHPTAQANRVQPAATGVVRLSGSEPRPQPRLETAGPPPSPVDLGAPLTFSLLLRRDPAAESAFADLLQAQQDPGSALFRHWLTPAEVGELFGPTPDDLAAVGSWIESSGLHVESVSPSRLILEVSGTRAAIASTLAVQPDFAGVPQAPAIPAALAPVVAGVSGLVPVPLESQALVSAPVTLPVIPRRESTVRPALTTSTGVHYLAPGDFARIYALDQVYTSGNRGATVGSKPQRIAVLGRSRVSALDISNFLSLFGLSAAPPNVLVPPGGTDPGLSADGNQTEATLDVERVLGTAPAAGIDLIVSKSSAQSEALYLAASYNINTLVDPVMSISFGACEANVGSATASLWNTLFQAGAAEGISIFVASGDAGAAGCISPGAPAPAVQVAGINFLCASAAVTCVGGTEFNDLSNPSAYWSDSASYFGSPTTSSSTQTAFSYIPEGVWNEPRQVTTAAGATGYTAAASGGGASLYVPKPAWQTGNGVPADNARDVPDVSFSAAGHDGYLSCIDFLGGDCANYKFPIVAGTSAATPAMAGIAALLNTHAGTPLGNLNPLLYSFAAGAVNLTFHDVTVASSGVGACSVSVPSLCNNSTPSSGALTGGLPGFSATPGYDLATGLGSVHAYALVNASSTTLTIGPSLTVDYTQPVTLSAKVLAVGAPTGYVRFVNYAPGVSFFSVPDTTLDANGIASWTGRLNPGVYPLVAAYSPLPSTNRTYGSSTARQTLTVKGLPTTMTACISGPASASCGPSVVLTQPQLGTVTLKVTSPAGTPKGFVGGNALATGYKLDSSGQATVPISSNGFFSGTRTISYDYYTDGAYESASATVQLTVLVPRVTITPEQTRLTVAPGATSGNSASFTVTSIDGYAGKVSLQCFPYTLSGNATGTCALSPSELTLGAGASATFVVTATTTAGRSGTYELNLLATAGFQTAPATLTVQGPTFALGSSATSLSFVAGATSGNSVTASVLGFNGFSDTVTLRCFVGNNGPGGVYNAPPACTLTPSSISFPNGLPSGPTTVSVTSTAASTTCVSTLDRSPAQGGESRLLLAAVAALLIPLGWPRRSSRRRSLLPTLLALVVMTAALGGCGGANGGAGTTTPAPTPTPACTPKTVAGTTPGSYVLHVAGSIPSGIGSTLDVPVTIQ